MFGLSTVKLAIIAGAVAFALSLGTWAFNAIGDHAVQNERNRIANANKASEERADAGQATVDDCIRAGRDWDRARGVCVNRSGR